MLRFSSATETGHAQFLMEMYLFRAKRHIVFWNPDLSALMEYGKEHPEESRHALECAGRVLTVLDVLENNDLDSREYALSLLRILALDLLKEAEGRATFRKLSRQEGQRYE